MSLNLGEHQSDLHTSGKVSLAALQYIPHKESWSMGVGSQAPDFRLATAGEQPKIPNVDVFETLSDSKPLSGPGLTALPTPAECAVHLELLEAFRTLREQVLASTELDAVFDIKPHPKTVMRGRNSKQIRDDTFAERRRQKWPLLIDLAVARFVMWFENVDDDLAARRTLEGTTSPVVVVPPLDILMVWHAFLLNPKLFAKHCESLSLTRVRKVPFPWAGIHAAINSCDQQFTFTPPPSNHIARNAFLERNLLTFLTWRTTNRELSDLLTKYGQNSPILGLQATRALPHLRGPERALVQHVVDAAAARPLARALADAVKRQVGFVDKMHAQLWIRSPALPGTVARAVAKYARFLELMRRKPGTMLIPTLDVDLAWHTHQLSHAHYRAAMEERAGRFVDHDDKLGPETLAPGMEKTAELWRVHFAEEYRVCLCWDCEALLSALEEAGDDGGVDSEALERQVMEDLAFYRCVELARRKGHPMPARGPKPTRAKTGGAGMIWEEFARD